MKERGPLFAAIVLLVLPFFYVGSYFVLVVPNGHWVMEEVGTNGIRGSREHYRCGAHRIQTIYWPLEQIDRRMRPDDGDAVFNRSTQVILQ